MENPVDIGPDGTRFVAGVYYEALNNSGSGPIVRSSNGSGAVYSFANPGTGPEVWPGSATMGTIAYTVRAVAEVVGCECFDFDGNGLRDLRDFAEFQLLMSP